MPDLSFKDHSAVLRSQLNLFHVNSVSLRKESFSMERVVYLWVVWVMFVMRKGHLFCNHLLTPGSYCSAACPAWPWVLFGICLVIQHQLAALMMSKFCHACDLEDLTFYIFLNSDLGLFWFTKHTDLYKAQKTLAASLHPIRLWTSPRLPWVKTQVLWFFFFLIT